MIKKFLNLFKKDRFELVGFCENRDSSIKMFILNKKGVWSCRHCSYVFENKNLFRCIDNETYKRYDFKKKYINVVKLVYDKYRVQDYTWIWVNPKVKNFYFDS